MKQKVIQFLIIAHRAQVIKPKLKHGGLMFYWECAYVRELRGEENKGTIFFGINQGDQSKTSILPKTLRQPFSLLPKTCMEKAYPWAHDL